MTGDKNNIFERVENFHADWHGITQKVEFIAGEVCLNQFVEKLLVSITFLQEAIRKTLDDGSSEKGTHQELIRQDRREIDHVFIQFRNSQQVLHAETKAASSQKVETRIKEAIKQLQWFKKYLERMHGAVMKDIWYCPAVAVPRLSICSCNPG